MNQIERIRHMEQNLEEASQALKDLDVAFEKYEKVQKQIAELSEYYGSDEWRKDYDDDSAGRLPQDLKRGVLSEDAVYNLLMENDRLKKYQTGIVDS